MSEFDGLLQVDTVLDQERKNKQALLFLLDAQNERKDHLLSVEARMGPTRSYVTCASLGWIAQKVRFATELPLFKPHRDPDTKKVALNAETAAHMQQRQPDWRRQFPMTLYLAKRQRHKFPPLLLVVTQEWVDLDHADEWGGNGRALRDSANAISLDSQGRIVDLYVSPNDLLYAIDGQHRLMAIKGLATLLDTGILNAKDVNLKDTGRSVTVDEIVEASNGEVTHSKLQQLLSESVGIEVIPAVMKGETRKDALRRIRSIFVHVNRTAKPLTEGELVLLDEDDGFSIIARLLMFTHPLLKERVLLKKAQLGPTSPEFTTLETLRDVAELLLGQSDEFRQWKRDSRTEMCMRPEEESLDHGYQKLVEYFDALETLPSHSRMRQGKEPKEIREETGNLLFRPLGQLALAEAIGILADRGVKLSQVLSRLVHGEQNGLLDIRTHESPWYGVVFDGKTMKRNESAKHLASRLLVHILGGGTPDEASFAELKRTYAAARIMPGDELATSRTGAKVGADHLELPAPW
jgi:hypothetical protein